MNTIKSIGAVLVGFLVIAFVSAAIDAALTAIGILPPHPEAYATWMFAVSVIYRCLISVLGGFAVGKLAPSKPLTHVVALAVIGTIIGFAGVAAGWNLPGYPHWYAIALAVLTFPTIWCGGKFADNRIATAGI